MEGARNKSGSKNENRGGIAPLPPAGDAPALLASIYCNEQNIVTVSIWNLTNLSMIWYFGPDSKRLIDEFMKQC